MSLPPSQEQLIYVSDVHLEYLPEAARAMLLENIQSRTTEHPHTWVVIAGDLAEPPTPYHQLHTLQPSDPAYLKYQKISARTEAFLNQISAPVLLVPGNHDNYSSDFTLPNPLITVEGSTHFQIPYSFTPPPITSDLWGKNPNGAWLRLCLNNNVIATHSFLIWGSTLWTDLGKNHLHPTTLPQLHGLMADVNCSYPKKSWTASAQLDANDLARLHLTSTLAILDLLRRNPPPPHTSTWEDYCTFLSDSKTSYALHSTSISNALLALSTFELNTLTTNYHLPFVCISHHAPFIEKAILVHEQHYPHNTLTNNELHTLFHGTHTPTDFNHLPRRGSYNSNPDIEKIFNYYNHFNNSPTFKHIHAWIHGHDHSAHSRTDIVRNVPVLSHPLGGYYSPLPPAITTAPPLNPNHDWHTTLTPLLTQLQTLPFDTLLLNLNKLHTTLNARLASSELSSYVKNTRIPKLPKAITNLAYQTLGICQHLLPIWTQIIRTFHLKFSPHPLIPHLTNDHKLLQYASDAYRALPPPFPGTLGYDAYCHLKTLLDINLPNIIASLNTLLVYNGTLPSYNPLPQLPSHLSVPLFASYPAPTPLSPPPVL